MIYKVKDRENLVVSSSVVSLTASKITSHIIYARGQIQVAPIRLTTDGTDPNPATHIGEIFLSGDSFEVWGGAMSNLKMIRNTIDDARVEVTYMGSG